jgi:hypothetical protein
VADGQLSEGSWVPLSVLASRRRDVENVKGRSTLPRAILSVAQREALEVDAGLSLGDSAETGQALLGLTWTEVVALADRIENPWDHGAIRSAAETFRHEGPAGVESRALRAALLRRARHELNGRRA